MVIEGEGRGQWARLGRGFDGALLGQVTGLSAVVAVQLRRLAAVHGNVTYLPTPARNTHTHTG